MVVDGTDASARAIERAGFGLWCHMANILADGSILDARDDVIQGIPAGVQIRPVGYLDGAPKWAIFEAPTDAHYAAWEAAGRSQLGKPYDERGIEDFAIGTFTGNYSDPNYANTVSKAWFCDELSQWMGVSSNDLPAPPSWFKYFTQTPDAALNLFIGAGWREIASRGLNSI